MDVYGKLCTSQDTCMVTWVYMLQEFCSGDYTLVGRAPEAYGSRVCNSVPPISRRTLKLSTENCQANTTWYSLAANLTRFTGVF